MWNYCLAAIFNSSNSIIGLAVLQGIWVTSAFASIIGIFYLAVDR